MYVLDDFLQCMFFLDECSMKFEYVRLRRCTIPFVDESSRNMNSVMSSPFHRTFFDHRDDNESIRGPRYLFTPAPKTLLAVAKDLASHWLCLDVVFF